MLIRITLVLVYIIYCLCRLAAPWRYFQLNARYFNKDKGIFSKIELDNLIPSRWRLNSQQDDGKYIPDNFPVFIKPEWGQNAQGIVLISNIEQFNQYRKYNKNTNINYFIQQAAPEYREFEIFAIMSADSDQCYSILNVSEAVYDQNERYPINSINNPHTTFKDISALFDKESLNRLWGHIKHIGEFRICRLCVRANSITQLIMGEFHVIEINLFLPMPINLLDSDYSCIDKLRFIHKYMKALALITKSTTTVLEPVESSIFARKMLYQRRLKLISTLRSIL